MILAFFSEGREENVCKLDLAAVLSCCDPKLGFGRSGWRTTALFGWEIQPATIVFSSHAKSASQPAVFSSHAKSASHPASQPNKAIVGSLIFASCGPVPHHRELTHPAVPHERTAPLLHPGASGLARDQEHLDRRRLRLRYGRIVGGQRRTAHRSPAHGDRYRVAFACAFACLILAVLRTRTRSIRR